MELTPESGVPGAPVAAKHPDHQPIVPLAGGEPPRCTCGYVGGTKPGELLADHLRGYDPTYGEADGMRAALDAARERGLPTMLRADIESHARHSLFFVRVADDLAAGRLAADEFYVYATEDSDRLEATPGHTPGTPPKRCGSHSARASTPTRCGCWQATPGPGARWNPARELPELLG